MSLFSIVSFLKVFFGLFVVLLTGKLRDMTGNGTREKWRCKRPQVSEKPDYVWTETELKDAVTLQRNCRVCELT